MTGNEDELRAKIDRAARMKEFAEGPEGLFEIFDKVRLAYLETIADSRPEDTKGREAMYHRLKAHDDITGTLRKVIAEGASAAVMLNALRKKQEKRTNVA